MKLSLCQWLLIIAAALLLIGAFQVSYAPAAEAADQVVNLPQDQEKWHLSVVGRPDETGWYHTLLGWFESDTKLIELKSQVHFHTVEYGTPIYRARYKPNVKGLPTVRLQRANGVVVYEAAAGGIPPAPTALYNAMATSAGDRYLLPWRRKQADRKPCPVPPKPPATPPPAPPAAPPHVGPPDFDKPSTTPNGYSVVLGIVTGLVGFLTGSGWSLVKSWREKKLQQ